MSGKTVRVSRLGTGGAAARIGVVIAAAIGLSACATAENTAQPVGPAVQDGLARMLAPPAAPAPASTGAAPASHVDAAVAEFYRSRGYQPIWMGQDGVNQRASALIERLAAAKADGLEPATYSLAAIENALASEGRRGLARAELLLSRALVNYAADLRGYRDPSGDLLTQIAMAKDAQKLFDDLIPDDPGYLRLREALIRYNAIAADGGWEMIPGGPSLSLDAIDPRVPLLRRRLAATGDLPATDASDSEIFDPAVRAAVMQFQRRHGLDEDGVVGKGTLATMNVPVAARIDELADNLARLRGQQYRYGDRAVIVNIAAAELVVIDQGREVLRSRTIVGQPGWETPRLSSAISAIEINPTWSVPSKIALKDLMPGARERGFDHLENRGFRVFDWNSRELDATEIDWASVDGNRMPFILRQDPGPGNALGHVKFLFANDQSIYLHDTPGRKAFNKAQRALSHGCVRVEAADELALQILKSQPGWDKRAYDRAVASGRTKRIRLDNPMPLYLVSFTAWVDTDGVVQFRNDPYGSQASRQIAA